MTPAEGARPEAVRRGVELGAVAEAGSVVARRVVTQPAAAWALVVERPRVAGPGVVGLAEARGPEEVAAHPTPP